MSYTPPAHNAVGFTWQGANSYSPPAYNAVDFNFQEGITGTGAATYAPIAAGTGAHGRSAAGAATYSPAAEAVAGHGRAATASAAYAPVAAGDALTGVVFSAVGAATYAPIAAGVAIRGVAAAVAAAYAPTASASAIHGRTAQAAATYQPSVVGQAMHGRAAAGSASYAPIAGGVAQHFNLFTLLPDAYSSYVAPVTFRMRGSGAVSAPIEFSVPGGQVSAPITFRVRGAGNVSAPIRLIVAGASLRWHHRVMLDGADVTDRVTGEVWDEQTEGAAHIAEFTLLPEAGAIEPYALIGKAVTIDHIRRETTGDIAQRRFTGKVDTPEYHPADGSITFRCTDDRPNRVNAMPRALLDTITGGRYHRAVHGEPQNNWAYAQALMSTVQKSLEGTPSGGIQAVPWAGLPVYRTLTLADLLDGSLRVTLPQRTGIVNTINATFEYRFNRLHRRTAHVRYSMDIYDVVHNAVPLLTRNTVEQALSSTGWSFFYARPDGGGESASAFHAVDTGPEQPIIHYTPYPETVNLPGGGIWSQSESDTTCLEFSCSLYKRWAQTVTETYPITVTAPQSVTENGTIARADSASLASEYDASAWEEDPHAAPHLDSTSQFETLDYAPDADTDDRAAAIETFVDTLKTTIAASHRSARVAATVLLDTGINLTRALRIENDRVTAEGKLVRVRHSSNADPTPGGGYALTELEITPSGYGSVGLPDVTETPTVPPAAPAVPAVAVGIRPRFGQSITAHIGATVNSAWPERDDWQGYIVNVQSSLNVDDPYASTIDYQGQVQEQEGYNGNYPNPNYVASKAYQNTGFRIILPGVEDDARASIAPTVAQTYEIPIHQDEFSLAA